MYEECPALLQMTRTFLEDGEKDEIIHHCKVIRYDPEEENIYLIAGKSDITYRSASASGDQTSGIAGAFRSSSHCLHRSNIDPTKKMHGKKKRVKAQKD